MSLTPVKGGTWNLPCLNCGRLLDYEVADDVIVCECGVKYLQEELALYRVPGVWRNWIAAFACACGKVAVHGDCVYMEKHRCRLGQVASPN